MACAWPDPISLVADAVTIGSVALVVVSNYRLCQELRRAREPKGVTQDCLEFYDDQLKLVITHVSLEKAGSLPRSGDIVTLPKDTYDGTSYDGGDYEVERVRFTFVEAEAKSDRAALLKVVAFVRRQERR